MRYARHAWWTWYDALEVNPSASEAECCAAYVRRVREVLAGDSIGGFELRGAMWRSQALSKIEELTAAIRVLGSMEQKQRYDAELRRQGIVCALCGGRGRVLENELSHGNGVRGVPGNGEVEGLAGCGLEK